MKIPLTIFVLFAANPTPPLSIFRADWRRATSKTARSAAAPTGFTSPLMKTL